MSAPEALPAAEGFRRWAPTYEETPLSLLEMRAFSQLAPPVEDRRVLDAGCGTGRRLSVGAARLSVGVDLVAEMLARARAGGDAGARHLVRADLEALPLVDECFDVAWCRLTIGFLPTLRPAFLELARVLRPGADLVVTDLHPQSAARGHVRSFRDASGRLLAVAHHVHPVEALLSVADGAGLDIADRIDLEVGPSVADVFAGERGRALYEGMAGRPVVLALRFRRR